MTADEEKHIEESSAPLIEHLIELRSRLVWSLVALGVGFVICWIFAEGSTPSSPCRWSTR